MKYRRDRGQSTVEYILMLAVVASLAAMILNSERFKKTLGAESEIFKKFAQRLEFTYRHGVSGAGDNTPRTPDFGKHETYYNTAKNTSRIFMSQGKYPE
ncbi:MAG: hypothetical protein AABY86_15295 [Bdellovibrionota bacterium]